MGEKLIIPPLGLHISDEQYFLSSLKISRAFTSEVKHELSEETKKEDRDLFSKSLLIIKKSKVLQSQEKNIYDLIERQNGKTWPITDEINAMALLVLPIFLFTENGSRTFKLSDNLQKMLQLTEAPRVLGDEIKLPFRCIRLALTSPVCTGYGLYCSYCYLYVSEAYGIVVCSGPGQGEDERQGVTFLIPLLPGVDTSESLKIFNKLYMSRRSQDIYSLTAEEKTHSELAKLIINFLLYLKCSESEVTEGEDNLKIMKYRNSNISSVKKMGENRELIYNIGKSLIIDDLPPCKNEKGLVNSGRKLSFRFMVRGFWRNQFCGKNGHKTTWVRPHFRGPGFFEKMINNGKNFLCTTQKGKDKCSQR